MMMNLPKIIVALIKSQDIWDSLAYANCFSETAIVTDEGNIYKGRIAIQHWIQKVNDTFKTVMKPVAYVEGAQILKAEITGNFDGSPILLHYYFELKEGLLQNLKITG